MMLGYTNIVNALFVLLTITPKENVYRFQFIQILLKMIAGSIQAAAKAGRFAMTGLAISSTTAVSRGPLQNTRLMAPH